MAVGDEVRQGPGRRPAAVRLPELRRGAGRRGADCESDHCPTEELWFAHCETVAALWAHSAPPTAKTCTPCCESRRDGQG